MKLDFIGSINEYGDNIVRLYGFDRSEAVKFRQAIQETIITLKQSLDILTLEFIQPRNCNLTLCISAEDEGIISSDNINFFCNLTINGYLHLLSLLEPFCKRETKGYQWLYDIDSPTDFLFSPGGTW